MRITIILFLFLFGPVSGICQNDTINQKDENDRKQGHWIYYGKDRPGSGYPESAKIEEGNYIDDRKEGLWVKYHMDGITVKLKGTYKNNRLYGATEFYYENGNIRRKGCISTSGSLIEICEEYTYYESGCLKEKRNYDSTVNYFESGCLMSISKVSPSDNGKYYTIHYSSDSCNIIKDTLVEVLGTNSRIIIERSDCVVRSASSSSNTTIDRPYKFPPAVKNPSPLIAPFKPDGSNKLLNDSGELWQEGEFKNGSLWNGRVYYYDSDGILFIIRVYKNGLYDSDGQL
ncbi:MAG: hypothetical protein RLZ33_1728 [Bacteroidota bacterium]|jgi:antitoxin component YwqK of YwqJK toxin-antitoxin module